ncbi:zinc-binding dehydrogenase [Dactylosporangium aurantiacum]|uniref:Zinc-binding dehydrogenase n=1 Tax=Dactylosporangium aurantiacum TaxID=35754 RepID=A0A9Q9IM77_9ACTN|nr:zinc-binding dehydrogenase [Dactylosporangium aurantiacum]MDG6102984.1 zinc-binding dehydrogenase [Dactylosporangium aurantiacum]UWZ57498.1 zinc-binding dehydrogenase [Dactylosporangium aurantiacum]
MLQYRLTGRRQLVLQRDAAKPVPGAGEVLVRVGANSICNRSDLAYYHYYGLRDHCATGCFGHEIAGLVEAVGPGVDVTAPGRRVFIRTPLTSGFAEYALARQIAVGALPDDVPFEQGSILQLLPLAVHATRGVRLGDRVAIVGQGPVGLMALQVARLRGATDVVVFDLDDWRLRRSAALGAGRCVRNEPGGDPAGGMDGEFDVAIEAVGSPATANACVRLVRQNGLVVFLGTHHVDTHVVFDMVQWEKKGLRVHTAAEPTDTARADSMRIAQRLVDAGRIDLSQLLTHVMPLEELPAAIELLSQSRILAPEGEETLPGPPPQVLKIAVRP